MNARGGDHVSRGAVVKKAKSAHTNVDLVPGGPRCPGTCPRTYWHTEARSSSWWLPQAWDPKLGPPPDTCISPK
ncbi:hypothetical protein DSO57_1023335 [Entomophthora muscae]|uniref:Uncharacterized protein n=1 Tax=Entomophthora muscae TaxID=34485 RepID=A0ACC2UN12_9FUNG|nr:hypothetical protein DSO57_1023335 [Entomophthora muscae]